MPLKLGSPFRAKASPGVSGLLSADAELYYHSISSTKHLGRVTDLLVAQLRNVSLLNGSLEEEVRIRALLLFGIFQAEWDGPRNSEKPQFESPLILECGFDSERLAISLSFSLTLSEATNLNEQFSGTKFAPLVSALKNHADGTLFRINRVSRRLETVAVLSLQHRESQALNVSRENTEWIEIDPQSQAEAPEVRSYVELGDLPYSELLREDDIIGLGELNGPTGDSTVAGEPPPEEGGDTEVGGPSLLKRMLDSMGFGKHSDEDNAETRIKKGKERLKRVRAGKGPFTDKEVWAIRKLGEEKAQLTEKVKSLEEKLQTIEKFPSERVAPVATVVSGGGAPEAEAEVVFTGSPKVAVNSEEVVIAQEVEEEVEIQTILDTDYKAEIAEIDGRQATTLAKSDTPTIVEDVEGLQREFTRGGFAQVIGSCISSYDAVKGSIADAKVKKWGDELMSTLTREKSRMEETVALLANTVKQKEQDFKLAEQRLLEEIRQKDQQIKQKTVALSRAKDHITQISDKLDKARKGQQNAKEELILRQKYSMSQKLLSDAKKERGDLARRNEDLRSQLMRAKNYQVVPEFVELRQKFEKANRQLEELKKSGPAGGLDKGALGPDGKPRVSSIQAMDEMKKKMEGATKQAAKFQSQNEQLQIKLEEGRREEARLKKENLMLQMEVRTIKSQLGAKPPAGTKPGKPNAA